MSVGRLRELFQNASDEDIARVATAWETGSGQDVLDELDCWNASYPKAQPRSQAVSFSIFLTSVLLFVLFSLPLAAALLHVNRGAEGEKLSKLLVSDLAVALTCPNKPGDVWRFLSRTDDWDLAAGTATAEVCGPGTYRSPEVLSGEERFSPAWIDDLETETLNAVNVARARYGKRPLKRHAALDEAAQEHAGFMSGSGLFQHSDGPYGENILKMPVGYVTHTRLGRPVLHAQVGTTIELSDKAVEEWLASPIHRRNLLSDTYTWTGLGVGVATHPTATAN